MNPEPAISPPNPRKRRFRWTPRSAIVLVALAALPMALVNWRVNAQRRAVAAVLRCGGVINYDYQRMKGFNWDDTARGPYVPKWLRWLPVECSQEIEVIMLRSEDVADRDLKDVSGLGGLLVFKSHGPGITDAGIAALSRCPKLEVLVIDGASITDAGVAHLASMKHLRLLGLSAAPITDASLESLGKIPSLEGVGLSETRVTEAGMERWRRLHPGINAFR